jgi:anthranilate synthase component 1
VHETTNGDLRIAETRVVEAPDLLQLAAAQPQRYPFLLESSAGASAQSRFDILLAFPGESLSVDATERGAGFFDALDAFDRSAHRTGVAGLPFVGGWFVYIGYEMAGRIEPRLDLPPERDPILPDAFAVRCPAAIIHDRAESRLYFIAEQDDRARIEQMKADLQAVDSPIAVAPLTARWQEQPSAEYRARVERARELIHAGDVFQVNLSRAWHGRLQAPTSPASVYSALRRANPAPFSALVQWQGAALACSSPERLMLIEHGVAQTRPIAGTRVRTAGTDTDMARELLAHPKERAEHVMLIDLERNDLGRVCRPGSITVDELMAVESYAHVHHIVSNIRGVLANDIGPGGALRAVFPGGTITGCPKVRCMEIIAELEGEGRGAYTGSVGYLSRCGRLDTNIVIRSLGQRDDRLTLRTGAGIVADSEANKELEETRIKARGVLRSFVDSQGKAYG